MITCACSWRGPIGAATLRRIRGGELYGSAFDTTEAATSYRCQSTSSYQVTCTACARDRFDHHQHLGAGGAARVEQRTYDALPPACFHVFDGGIEVGPRPLCVR